MSAENVAVIRRLNEAFNAGDVDAQLAALDPEVEFFPMRAQLEGTAYRGHEGFRRWLADIEEDWDFIRFDADRFVDHGDAVVTLGHLKTRGSASGVDIDVPMGLLWRLREGRVIQARTYSNQEDALRAAGLEPESAA